MCGWCVSMHASSSSYAFASACTCVFGVYLLRIKWPGTVSEGVQGTGGTGRSLIRPASLHGLFWCFCNERLLGRVNSESRRGPFDVKWCERRWGWRRRGGAGLRKEWMLRGPARSGEDEEKSLLGRVAAGDFLSHTQEGVKKLSCVRVCVLVMA